MKIKLKIDREAYHRGKADALLTVKQSIEKQKQNDDTLRLELSIFKTKLRRKGLEDEADTLETIMEKI